MKGPALRRSTSRGSSIHSLLQSRSATARAAQPAKLTGYPLAEYKELVGLDQLAELLSARAPRPLPSDTADVPQGKES